MIDGWIDKAYYIVMHISYGSKDSTQAFATVHEQCFLWERVTPFGVDLGLFH